MLNKFESHQTFHTFFCNTTFYSFMFGPAMVTGVASAVLAAFGVKSVTLICFTRSSGPGNVKVMCGVPLCVCLLSPAMCVM